MIIERDKKWEPVGVGFVIQTGQPYAIEHPSTTAGTTWSEHVWNGPIELSDHDGGSSGICKRIKSGQNWYVDSTWKPPIDLPVEPTWGIVVEASEHGDGSWLVDRWCLYKPKYVDTYELGGEFVGMSYSREGIAAFIPLTKKQIKKMKDFI